jgi:DNA-binding response OmpR family regulator
MPDFSALDFLRYVGRNCEPHVPVVVMSSATSGSAMNKALEAGADEFLSKPVSIEALVRVVDQVLPKSE